MVILFKGHSAINMANWVGAVIKYEGDRCFSWKLPHCVTCTSLLPSLVFSHMTLVVHLWSLEECTLLSFLGRVDFLGFTI